MTRKSDRKKSGCLKRFILGLIALVVLAGAAVAIVPRFIPWEKIKHQAEEKLSQTLRHKVTMGSVGFNPLRGIEVKQLRVANAKGFGQDALFSDEAVIVRYRLVPLIFGRLVIKTIELDRPQVLVERAADGRFNFSDMISGKKETPAKAAPADAGPLALPVELLIAKIQIKDGSLVYRQKKPRQEYRVDELNLKIENLTLAGMTPVNTTLSAKVKALGQTLPVQLTMQWRLNWAKSELILDQAEVMVPGMTTHLQGNVGQFLDAPALKLSLQVGMNIENIIKQLLPAEMRKKIPAEVGLAGTVQVDLKVSGPAKDPKSLALECDDQADIKIKMAGAELPLVLKGNLKVAAGNLNTQQQATLPGLKTEVKASLKDLFSDRNLAASLKTELELANMFDTWIPPALKQRLPQIAVGGKMQASAQVKGPVQEPKKLEINAQVQLNDGKASYQDKKLMENCALTMTLDAHRISMPSFTSRLAGHKVKATFAAKGFDLRDPATLKPKTLKADVLWTVESEMLDLDAVLALLPKKPAAAGPKSAQAEKTVSDLPEPDVQEWIPAGLVMQGKANLGGLKFGTVKLGAITSAVELKDRLITAKNRLLGYRGEVENTTRLNFGHAHLTYAVDSQVERVDLEPLLNDVVDTFLAAKLKKPELIAELKDKLAGRLNSEIRLTGKGMRTKTAKPNLRGEGSFQLAQGRLHKFAFQDNLATWFGNDKFRQDIPFDRINGKFTIAQQKVDLTEFVADSGPKGESGDIRMTAKGQLTFKAEFKDMRLYPQLNPRAQNNLSPEFGRYSEVLKDERGWVTIPAKLNGPIRKPDVQPDWDWIKAQFQKGLERKTKQAAQDSEKKVKTFVDQQKGKSPDEVKQNMNQELEKAKDKLKNMDLKNLFK